MSRYAIVLVVSLIFISCGKKDKQASGILDPVKMQAVLWDVIRADAYISRFTANDTSKNIFEEEVKLQKQVFDMHGVSRETFNTSFNYYKLHPPQMKLILDSMTAKGNRDKLINIKTSPTIEKQ